MNAIVKFLSHDQPEWMTEIPDSFTDMRLPGGRVFSAVGQFGSMCIQDFRDRRYCMRYTVLDLVERFIIQTRERQKGLFIRIMLKNAMNQQVPDEDDRFLREGQFSMLQKIKPRITMLFEAAQKYVHFDAYFSAGMVKEVLPLFPEVQELLGTEGFVLTKPRRTDGQTRELINSILRCRLEGDQRRYFFESLVKNLLFRLLVQLNEKEPEKGSPTEREIDAVYKAERIISEDLKQHFHIPELARKVQINEFRLKLVFRKIFGSAVHEYRQRKRLERAKEMLEAGIAVKVVAAENGYRITHFITAFQVYYGYTPGSIKRNKQA